MLKKISVLFLFFLTIFSLSSCKTSSDTNPDDNNPVDPIDPTVPEKEYVNMDYENNTYVGYAMDIIDTVERKIPNEFKNEGLERYPIYNKVLSGATEEEKQKIIAENEYIRASSSTYDSMDSEGNLYLNGEKLDRKLYRHTASEGNYGYDVSDDEVAVVKEIKILPNKIGTYITGLYAPAGEVIKVSISSEDLEAIDGSFEIVIGQKQQRKTKENDIWPKREFVRMPLLVNTMKVTQTEAYVGSFLGGPLYIDSVKNIDKPITITISGAVEYHHYIQGLTTREDFLRTSKSTAPFFELAVVDDSVRHNGPRNFATLKNGKELTFDDCYDISIYWQKVSDTSKKVPSGSRKDACISFLYEPFIAAGAAVAFVGNNWVNCPLDWFSQSLDYKELVRAGSWGNMHEYNHHYQNYGLANNGEVSNNATTLLSYALYTEISALRNKNDDGKLSGWNRFVDPSRSLRETFSIKDPNYTLSSYADLLHSFGVDIFIQATQKGNGTDNWYREFSYASGYDLTFYFENILHLTLSPNVKQEVANKKMPIFIPAATIYQTGRGFYQGEELKFSNTVKPYKVDGVTTLDFNKDLIIPENFEFSIKSITDPTSGKLVKKENNVYDYIPGSDSLSGKIYLTIVLSSKIYKIDNVEVTLFEFPQN